MYSREKIGPSKKNVNSYLPGNYDFFESLRKIGLGRRFQTKIVPKSESFNTKT